MKAAALGLLVAWLLVLLGLLLAAESSLARGVGFSGLLGSTLVEFAVGLHIAVVMVAAFFPPDLVLGQKVFSRSSKVVFTAAGLLAPSSCRLLLIEALVLLIIREGGTCGHST